jgi:hypothetical protein
MEPQRTTANMYSQIEIIHILSKPLVVEREKPLYFILLKTKI